MHDADPRRGKWSELRTALTRLRELTAARSDAVLIAAVAGVVGPERKPWVQLVTVGASSADLRAVAQELLDQARTMEAAEQRSVAEGEAPPQYWWQDRD